MTPHALTFVETGWVRRWAGAMALSTALGANALAQSPGVTPACQSIQGLHQSLALTRTLQDGIDTSRQADRQARLDYLAQQISLPALASTETIGLPALQDGLIATYLTS